MDDKVVRADDSVFPGVRHVPRSFSNRRKEHQMKYAEGQHDAHHHREFRMRNERAKRGIRIQPRSDQGEIDKDDQVAQVGIEAVKILFDLLSPF